MLSTGQAAVLCTVKPDTVLKWIKKGRLPAVRTAGGHYRISEWDLKPFMGSSPSPEPTPQVLRCWEYLNGESGPRDECKNCVVYRVRATWCFEVAGLGRDLGHTRQFCLTSCQDCAYYRRVSEGVTKVLVITSDDNLVRHLAAPENPHVAIRFARDGYETSALLPGLRPTFVVVDEEVIRAGEPRLLDALAADLRVPGIKIILAVSPGKSRRREIGKLVAGVIEKPFDVEGIAAVVRRFPIESLTLGVRSA